jgi:hypothetical protein
MRHGCRAPALAFLLLRAISRPINDGCSLIDYTAIVSLCSAIFTPVMLLGDATLAAVISSTFFSDLLQPLDELEILHTREPCP